MHDASRISRLSWTPRACWPQPAYGRGASHEGGALRTFRQTRKPTVFSRIFQRHCGHERKKSPASEGGGTLRSCWINRRCGETRSA
jgi:hypothetical protein